MKRILSLILTLLVSLTSLPCLVYADNYDVTYSLTNIGVKKSLETDTGYQIDFAPYSGYAMPNSIEVTAGGETLIQCTSGGIPAGCSYTYNRQPKSSTSTLLIYDTNKGKDIKVTASGVTWNVKYSILDNGTDVSNLFYNVSSTAYSWGDDDSYTNIFGISTYNVGYANYGIYLLPSDIEVKAGDTVLTKCDVDNDSNCDYSYDNNKNPGTAAIFGNNQNGALTINQKYCGEDITITVNLNRLARDVVGSINEYGYFNNDTSKTGSEVSLDKAYKADKSYTTYINAYAYSKLPGSIKVYVYPTTTHTWTETTAYSYDSKTGKVTFKEGIFDYNEKFKIVVENSLRDDMSIKASACNATIEGATGKDSSGCSLYEASNGKYGNDVTIKFSKNDGTNYPSKDEINVTVDGNKFTGFSYENGVITIAGNDVKGDIEISATCLKYPTGVSITGKNTVYYNGSETEQSSTLVANLTPSDAAYSKIVWKSSDESIASVSASEQDNSVATLKGLKEGTVTISAYVYEKGKTSPTVKAEYKVQVLKKDSGSSGKVVTCEEANGKGWTWSESKKACVYKVTNTSSK